MARFLAIFNGAADEAALTDAQQTALMDAWARWAQADEPALADPGAPLNANKLVTARGIEDVTDAMTGYALVEAGSHDEGGPDLRGPAVPGPARVAHRQSGSRPVSISFQSLFSYRTLS
jgi:hypothetical protein